MRQNRITSDTMTLGFCSSILLLVKLYKCCRFFIRHVFHRFPYISQIIRVIQLTKPILSLQVLFFTNITQYSRGFYCVIPNLSHFVHYRACCLCYNIVTYVNPHTTSLTAWQSDMYLKCCGFILVVLCRVDCPSVKISVAFVRSSKFTIATCSPDCDLYNLHMFSECMAWHAD